jgi:hypothetical protein
MSININFRDCDVTINLPVEQECPEASECECEENYEEEIFEEVTEEAEEETLVTEEEIFEYDTEEEEECHPDADCDHADERFETYEQ